MFASHDEVVFGRPDAEQHNQGQNGRERAEYVRKLRPEVVGHEELRSREADAAQGSRRQHASQRGDSAHDKDQISGHDQRHRRADAAHVGAEIHQRQARNPRQRNHRDSNGAERHRRCVCEQADARRIERRESEARHHRRGHRDGCTESGRAFNECAERERHKQRLQPAVCRDGADGILHHFELPRVHRDAVQNHRPEHNPHDREEAEERTVCDRARNERHRHSVYKQSHCGGYGEPGQSRHPGGLSQHSKHQEKREDGERGGERRHAHAFEQRCVVLLPHG
jgi:hypothetical protein